MRWFTAANRSRISRLHEFGERTAQRLDQQAWRLLDRFEPLSRAVRNVTTIEAFNLALILAAQAFLTLVPLVIVIAAFTPRLLGVQLSAQLQGALGLANSPLAFKAILASPGRVARVGGTVGLVLLLSAGLSFVTALQRAYEKVWQLPRLSVVRSSWRVVIWLAVCTLALPASGLADAALRAVPGGTAVLVLIGLAGTVLFWWWTPHLLLGARADWRALLPSAVLTGGLLAGLIWLSPLIMPTLVGSTEGEFGVFGTVFVVMLWLTFVCSVVVLGAILGEAVARDRRVAPWTRPPAQQPPPEQQPPAARGDPAPPAAPEAPAPPGPSPGMSPPPDAALPAASEADGGGTDGARPGQGDSTRAGRTRSPDPG
jgi:membrane protein